VKHPDHLHVLNPSARALISGNNDAIWTVCGAERLSILGDSENDRRIPSVRDFEWWWRSFGNNEGEESCPLQL
jgi:hypothetical protein